MNDAKVGGSVLLLVLTLLWGMSWPIGKLALREIDPWTLRATTVVGSGALLLAYARLTGEAFWPKPTELLSISVTAFFNITAWHMLSGFGLRVSDAAHAVIVLYTMPIWATLLSVWLLSERIRSQSILALALVIASLAVLVGGNAEEVIGRPLGLVLLLSAAVSWAYGTILQKGLKTGLSLTAVAGWQLMLGGVPILLGMALWGSPHGLFDASAVALAAVAYSLASKLFCYWAWFRVVGIFPAHAASIGTAATPVCGVIASGIILNEALGLEEWGALSLVVAGLCCLTLQKWSTAGEGTSRLSDPATRLAFPGKDGRRL